VSEANKTVVRRLVAEVFNGGHLEVIDELYAPALAGAAKRWITPFRASFPDVHMELVELIAEGDTVVARFTCSATHLGEWLGQAPTGRRFERVKEVLGMTAWSGPSWGCFARQRWPHPRPIESYAPWLLTPPDVGEGMRSRVELFESIRRDGRLAGMGIRAWPVSTTCIGARSVRRC
jgi:hypothetical protein